jgi:hypothetical protein
MRAHLVVRQLSKWFLLNSRPTNYSKFIFVKKLYMFRAIPLPIIRSSPPYIQRWYMSCNFDDSFQAHSSWACLKAVIKLAWHIPVPNVQWRTPDDGQRNCPKHVAFHGKNKFGKISASVSFIKKKFVTMHGHMNIKFNRTMFDCCPHVLKHVVSCKPEVCVMNRCRDINFCFWVHAYIDQLTQRCSVFLETSVVTQLLWNAA